MKILMIAHVASHPGTSGNGCRIRSLAENIEVLGHELHFLYLSQKDVPLEEMKAHWADRLHMFQIRPYPSSPAPRVLGACQRLDRMLATRRFANGYYRLIRANLCVYGVDDWYDDRLSPYLRTLQEQGNFDAVLVAYVFNSKALTCFPTAVRKVIDTHDVFADRHQRFFAAGDRPSWFFTTRRQERRGLQRAQVVLAIQDEEARYFEQLQLKETRVLTVGHTVKFCGLVEPPTATDAPAILFLGSDNPMNRDALRQLQECIYPRIRDRLPRSRLIVAGAVSKFAHRDESVDIRGVVEDLTPLYQAATVVMNPVRFGTGLKIKSVEALAHGKPLITTDKGIEGLSLPGEEVCVVANSADALAEATLALLQDDRRCQRLSRNALAYAGELNRQTARRVADIFA